MSPARRPWIIVILFGLLVLASRLPLAPGQLFTFDDVNLAYAIGHFDIRISQPHPPGYPLFVMEMRLLTWLRFRRPESILLALALAGSVAALVLLVFCGNRILGDDSGYYAAWLTVFHPVFWHAGLTSALRVQLALVSVSVAMACWRAWRGDGRWVLWSALMLGTGAGIRPETGPLLFPLWAASAWRARVSWKEAATALSAMAAVVLLWLLPAMFASGGPAGYVKACLNYIGDQASVSSALFGATETKWITTFWRLVVWTLCGLLPVSLPAVLAWRRNSRCRTLQDAGWGLDRDRLAFLGLWFFPAFIFAINVHVEDPGQTLAMVPAVSLLGGYILNRAVDDTSAAASAWRTQSFAVLPPLLVWMCDFRDAEFVMVWAPLACLAAPMILRLEESLMSRARDRLAAWVVHWHILPVVLIPLLVMWFLDRRDPAFLLVWVLLVLLGTNVFLRLAQSTPLDRPLRSHVAALLLAPVVLLDCIMFFHQGWYYRGASTSGLPAAAEQVLADLNSGLALTSLDQIQSTLAVDDHTLRQIKRLAAERPGQTVAVWEHGLAAWRKVAYYLPDLPIVVLDHSSLRAGSQPLVAVWKGPKLEQSLRGAPPLHVALPANTGRIVWLLNPRSAFYDLVQRSFAPADASPVSYTDLPRTDLRQSGSRMLGDYEISW